VNVGCNAPVMKILIVPIPKKSAYLTEIADTVEAHHSVGCGKCPIDRSISNQRKMTQQCRHCGSRVSAYG